MIDRAEDRFWAYDNPSSETKGLVLLDNVQFIYELSLAELELKALGVEFEVKNGLREFTLIKKTPHINKTLLKRTSYFKSLDGTPTDYFKIIQKNRTPICKPIPYPLDISIQRQISPSDDTCFIEYHRP